MSFETSRRRFLQTLGVGTAAFQLGSAALAQNVDIQGFEETGPDQQSTANWKPISDRKIRFGLVGYGVCKFATAFGLQDHPNVEVVAVSDLVPERCAALSAAARCKRTYSSLEKLVEDDQVEAVFVATDAPSHARHAIEVLKHGKHVAVAVPACFGSLDEADELFAMVKGAAPLKYMMFETSCYHADLHAMRELYRQGLLGPIVYAEGEYYHYMPEPIDSYEGWRIGLPPQWYPTHSNAYYIGVTGGSFTEVSCMGMPSKVDHLKANNNRYQNPFGTEIALFRTNEGSMARMAVSWDTPGASGEMGRVRGRDGSFYGQYQGNLTNLPNVFRPPLPPSVQPGGHGGSHGYLADEFISAILQDRQPLVDISMALNMTVSGVVAHQSALKDGELMKIPVYHL